MSGSNMRIFWTSRTAKFLDRAPYLHLWKSVSRDFRGVALLLAIAASTVTLSVASSDNGTGNSTNDEQPKDFKYIQLWADEDGETHITEARMTGFKLQPYASLPQFVRNEFGGEPTKMIFTELPVGFDQPLHSPPAVQFVVTLSGSWYIKTTDGQRYNFTAGEVLFQDNTKSSPAKKQPEHLSGTVGDKPCQQFVVQFNRTPEVNNPNAF